MSNSTPTATNGRNDGGKGLVHQPRTVVVLKEAQLAARNGQAFTSVRIKGALGSE
jgi:hypothetical protein